MYDPYGQPVVPTPLQPGRKSRKTLRIALGATGGVMALCCGVGAVVFGKVASDSRKGHTITYEVTGTTASNITFQTSGGQSQLGRTDLPWTSPAMASQGLPVATVVAQTMNTQGGISCRILVDGKPKAVNHSDGAFAVVSCTASDF